MANRTRPFAPFEFMIAWRYLRARRAEGGVSVMTWISLIGIALGVMALVATLAVRAGFRAEFVDTILGSNAHVSVYKLPEVDADGFVQRGMTDYEATAERIRTVPGIVRAAPVIKGQAMISYADRSNVAEVIGITADDLGALPRIADGPEALTASFTSTTLGAADLAKVIPGCHALHQTGPNRYRADVTVGVGMIKARYAAEIALSDLEPPRRLRLAGSGLSSMGAAKGSGLVTLEPRDGGTLLRYDYEAEVSGKVAAVGGRMLEGAAKIVLRQLFEQLGRQAGGKGATPSGSWWERLLARLGVAR